MKLREIIKEELKVIYEYISIPSHLLPAFKLEACLTN